MYNKFKLLLEENGVTAYRVAKDTELPTSFFSEWKKGKSNPKVDKLKILANYFGVTLDYFVS